jgi:hypothetical protein
MNPEHKQYNRQEVKKEVQRVLSSIEDEPPYVFCSPCGVRYALHDVLPDVSRALHGIPVGNEGLVMQDEFVLRPEQIQLKLRYEHGRS